MLSMLLRMLLRMLLSEVLLFRVVFDMMTRASLHVRALHSNQAVRAGGSVVERVAVRDSLRLYQTREPGDVRRRLDRPLRLALRAELVAALPRGGRALARGLASRSRVPPCRGADQPLCLLKAVEAAAAARPRCRWSHRR